MNTYDEIVKDLDIYEHIKYLTKARVWSLPLNDIIKNGNNLLGHMPIDTFNWSYGKNKSTDDQWVCVLYQSNDYSKYMGVEGEHTYWIMPQKEKPTENEALHWIFSQLLFILDHNYNYVSFPEYLNKKAKDGIIINNYIHEETKHHKLGRVYEKFFCDILHVGRFEEVLQRYESKFYVDYDIV